MNKVFIIVPTLDPDEMIMENFINELHKKFKNIMVVNDGSSDVHNNFFESLEKKGIIVYKHYKNCGKGRAIKSAFNYILNNYSNIEGVVTCDCDGQHSVNDVKNIADHMIENKNKLILGFRNLDKKNVPFKSKYGNAITKVIFKILIGLDLADTQTGLRGLSKDLMIEFMNLPGERYEFETNMLIACKERRIAIKEVEIETIYLNSNTNSHFDPLKDSVLIYQLFMKYFLASFSSFLLDIVLFAGLLGILEINSKILAATILARAVSSIYNYLVNSNFVFKNLSLNTLVKYYGLVIVQMFISGCFVTYLSNFFHHFSIIGIKMIVDTILWIFNLVIEREFVFKKEKNEK